MYQRALYTILKLRLFLQVQFPLEEHHRITGGSRPTVLVSERRFTSIIAYALSCEQYRAKLQLLKPDTDQVILLSSSYVLLLL